MIIPIRCILLVSIALGSRVALTHPLPYPLSKKVRDVHVTSHSCQSLRTGAPHICAGRVSEGVQKEHEDVHVSASSRYVHWR